MPNLAAPVLDEIRYQMSQHIDTPGKSGEWRSVPVWPTTFTMMTAIATRFLVGKEFSRNDAFTKKIGEFTRAVSIESIFLKGLPALARPIAIKFLHSKKRYCTLREMLRKPIMALLAVNEEGKVVMATRESSPVGTFTLNDVNVINRSQDDPMLPQFVAFVLPKYANTIKDPAEMKEKILNEVVGRYLVVFFAAVSLPQSMQTIMTATC